MGELPKYVLEREFHAPPELVWKAWTEPDLLRRWYGPGVETTIHRFEPRPGGLWLLEMRWGENSSYQRAEFTDVTPPRRLVWLHSVADADWNVVRNPMAADWPRVLLTTVTFEEDAGRTRLRLTWVPHDASEVEIAGFRDALPGMDQGWSAGMELLSKITAELQA